MMLKRSEYFKRKEHRLDSELYQGAVRVSFTLCVKNRYPVFTATEIVDTCVNALKETLDKYDCENWIYVFMPDHVHLVLEGKSDGSDVLRAIALFKQKTGYCFSRFSPETKWQKSSYDHIHRKDEDLTKHIRYILNNPVRKGLCREWNEYPFKGSLHRNIDSVFSTG